MRRHLGEIERPPAGTGGLCRVGGPGLIVLLIVVVVVTGVGGSTVPVPLVVLDPVLAVAVNRYLGDNRRGARRVRRCGVCRGRRSRGVRSRRALVVTLAALFTFVLAVVRVRRL